MNYSLNCPSLEHIALVKVATTLWNQDNIRALISKINYEVRFPHYVNMPGLEAGSERRKEWQEIENKVLEKVQHLSLPPSLKEEILGFIKPVGLQILEWKEYQNEKGCLCIGLPSELCWTPQGTVDLKKTAKALIKDENLDVISRYKLACTYCLEDDVLELWKKIPENRRKYFYGKKARAVRQQDLVVFWTYDIKGELNKLDKMIRRRWQLRDMWLQVRSRCSPYQYAFETAAVGGNKEATEYFLQKLTSRERKESLVRTAENVANSMQLTLYAHSMADVLCFLLSQMDEKHQIKVFKRCPDLVLKCLLYWPWQSLFLETANCMWDFLPAEDYDFLLCDIVDKVSEGHEDYNYQKLFREFWQQSPNAHKRYVIDECAKHSFLLSSLFEIKDNENVKLILKDATLIEKRKLVFSDMGQDICQDLILGDEWYLLQFFIRECISSKDEMIKFKEKFEGRLIWRKEKFAKKKDQFFLLFDDFINRYNKRKNVAEGDSSPAKRFHSAEFEEVTHTIKK